MYRTIICVFLAFSCFYISNSEANTAALVLNVTAPYFFNPPHLKSNATKRFSGDNTNNLFASLYHIQETQVAGIIGAQTSTHARVVQGVAKLYAVPQVAFTAISYILSDKSEYPYFLRSAAADSAQVVGIIEFFKLNGWTKGIVCYQQDDNYGSGYVSLVTQASAQGISILPIPVPNTVPGVPANLTSTGQRVKETVDATGYRIFILYTGSATFSAAAAIASFGLVGPEYVYILTGGAVDTARFSSFAQYNASYFQGAFGFGSGLPNGPLYEELRSYWQSLPTSVIGRESTTYVSQWFGVDSALAYAHAVQSLIEDSIPLSNIKGDVLLKRLLNQTFLGTTGNVVLDEFGDRKGQLQIWNWINPGPQRAVQNVATYDSLNSVLSPTQDFIFFDGTSKVPRDSPYVCNGCQQGTCVVDEGCKCFEGWRGSQCDVKDSSSVAVYVWLIPVVVATIVIIGGVYYYFRRQKSLLVKEVTEKQRSQIQRGDLEIKDRIGRGASGEVFKGVFRGTEVAIKKIVTSHVDKKTIEEFELEVAIMCGLRHPAIILFMGSCYDSSSHEMLLVMEYMMRGSLNDVLNNFKIPLSYEMKLHLASQAAQGMNFLHQANPPIIHLDLKSHNILLDDKWNARISDFGITKFKDSPASKKAGGSIGTIYWTAPELLSGDGTITEKCDCYSFGIVLWELFHRKNPYQGKDPAAVAVDVITKQLRPPMSPEVSAPVQQLIRACWAPDPADRPTFQEIMNTLRSLSAQAPLQSIAQGIQHTDAPTGLIYIVSTDVLNAFPLWNALPGAMEDAMKLHNQVVRNIITSYNGYEAGFLHHSFTLAFSTCEDAINFCIALQISLLNVNWPDELLAHPCGKAVYDGSTLIWKGLRVKMAIASGSPNCEVDPTGRMTYFGPVMDRLAQILKKSTDSILVADAVADNFTKKLPALIQEILLSRVGQVQGSARNKGENIHKITIKSLSGRNSEQNNSDYSGSMPHAIISIDDYETGANTEAGAKEATPINETVDWITTMKEIHNKEVIGKGPLGDYFRGQWHGKDVAIKVLVNQKLKEEDLFRLTSDSATMSKLQHPNILPFYALCLEPNNISIVSEYEAKGNLKALLADSSVQFPHAKKVKILLEIAHGMSYLTSLPNPAMQMHDNLKSNNILIGRDWEVKIADYGHSNIRELARTMTSVGNIAWTAPEILSGGEVTFKISTYSFAIIMWELLARQQPYANAHPIRVVSQILSGLRPPVPVDCPTPYKELMEQCWQADSEARPSWSQIITSLSAMK